MAKAPNFTPELAREYGIKGGIIRRAKAQARREALAEAEQARLNSPIPSPASATEYRQLVNLQQADGYNIHRIASVRAQIERLDGLMLKTTDAHKLDRLASALAKLSELERVLDGRPLPGSHRPTKAPSKRPSLSSIGPLEDVD